MCTDKQTDKKPNDFIRPRCLIIVYTGFNLQLCTLLAGWIILVTTQKGGDHIIDGVESSAVVKVDILRA